MQKTKMTKSYGNGFDHMESETTYRDFLAWWNEKSYFPFEAPEEGAADQEFPMAA